MGTSCLKPSERRASWRCGCTRGGDAGRRAHPSRLAARRRYEANSRDFGVGHMPTLMNSLRYSVPQLTLTAISLGHVLLLAHLMDGNSFGLYSTWYTVYLVAMGVCQAV